MAPRPPPPPPPPPPPAGSRQAVKQADTDAHAGARRQAGTRAGRRAGWQGKGKGKDPCFELDILKTVDKELFEKEGYLSFVGQCLIEDKICWTILSRTKS